MISNVQNNSLSFNANIPLTSGMAACKSYATKLKFMNKPECTKFADEFIGSVKKLENAKEIDEVIVVTGKANPSKVVCDGSDFPVKDSFIPRFVEDNDADNYKIMKTVINISKNLRQVVNTIWAGL